MYRSDNVSTCEGWFEVDQSQAKSRQVDSRPRKSKRKSKASADTESYSIAHSTFHFLLIVKFPFGNRAKNITKHGALAADNKDEDINMLKVPFQQ